MQNLNPCIVSKTMRTNLYITNIVGVGYGKW